MLDNNHGTGNPTVISNIFDPIELDTAISPWPFEKRNKLKKSMGKKRKIRKKEIFTIQQLIFWTKLFYLPCLATMTDVNKSGTLVPAAKNVNPIM